MNSIGLDTSIVLRLLVGAPEDQAKRALELVEDCFQKQVDVFVSDLVVQETYHALCHHYQVPVREAVECLRDFLASEMIANTGQALAALQEYSGKGPGFADSLIRRDYLQDKIHAVFTFDKKFSQLTSVQKL